MKPWLLIVTIVLLPAILAAGAVIANRVPLFVKPGPINRLTLYFGYGWPYAAEHRMCESGLGRSPSNHSYDYAFSDDHPKLPLLLTPLTYFPVGNLLSQLCPENRILHAI
ncbi:MAG: hypothetical protein BMS9Abin15_0379 [Gammaproteobacteria bacterium]|nr:MAG: hypothetical protein BMS9Abin15_0379 [Gammaproteobacteria bacterium]